MPGPSDVRPEDRTAWLLLIGRRLKAEYDAVAEPVPPRLAALIEQLETSPPDQEYTSQPAGRPDRDRLKRDGSDMIGARRKRAG